MSHAVALPAPRRRTTIGDVIRWAFGVKTVITNTGKKIWAERLFKTSSIVTYTESPHFCAMGIGAHGAAREAKVTDAALTNEKETRATGAETVTETTIAADTYTVKGTQTATASRAIDEAGLFDASTVGNMFTSATIETDNLENGDSIAWTWKVQLT